MDNSKRGQDPDTKLLHLLSTEIALDGGASLTTLIKEFYVVRPKLVDSLLLKTVGSKQLLKFFERHPTVFEVDRSSAAHHVTLLTEDYVDACILNGEALDDCLPVAAIKMHRRQALQDKVLYTLRKRNALMARRQRPNDTLHVSGEWLLRQCKIPVHLYLRASGFYRRAYSSASHQPVKLVGSPEWEELVLPEFMLLLQDWVSFTADKKIFLADNDNTLPSDDIRQFASKLQEVVDKDGATQISWALLLHREPDLRRLLGGRDLLLLLEQHAEHFHNLTIVVSEDQRYVYLQSTKERTGRRMQVDETGLFSVASSRWSTAMANILANQCRQALGTNASDTVALDLTASVGGITLGLAKVFASVIAIEIDSHRAVLCRQNIQTHGVDAKVEVRNVDTMREIEHLPTNSVVFLDPPWGGHDYKRERYPLAMDPWAFEDVLEKVGRSLAPCICGIRLPVTYQVDGLLATMTERNIAFKVLRSKLLGPQLFLCLYFEAAMNVN